MLKKCHKGSQTCMGPCSGSSSFFSFLFFLLPFSSPLHAWPCELWFICDALWCTVTADPCFASHVSPFALSPLSYIAVHCVSLSMCLCVCPLYFEFSLLGSRCTCSLFAPLFPRTKKLINLSLRLLRWMEALFTRRAVTKLLTGDIDFFSSLCKARNMEKERGKGKRNLWFLLLAYSLSLSLSLSLLVPSFVNSSHDQVKRGKSTWIRRA